MLPTTCPNVLIVKLCTYYSNSIACSYTNIFVTYLYIQYLILNHENKASFTDPLYFWLSESGSSRFNSSLWGVVVGHFSSDGVLKNDHFNLPGEKLDDTFAYTEIDLLQKIIKIFSYEGHFVLDLTATEGLPEP